MITIAPDAPLAVNVMPHDARHVVERAVAAERLGIPRLVLPDAGRSTRDPWVTLGAVGAAVQLAGMGVSRPADVETLAAATALVRSAGAGEVWVATKGPRTIRAVAASADVILLSGVPFGLIGEVAARTREVTGARVAFTLHHFFDAASRAASGERLVYEITNMRPEYADAGGVDATLRDEVLATLRTDGALAAGARIPDGVLARFALGPDQPHPLRAAAELAARFGVDELVVPEASIFGTA